MRSSERQMLKADLHVHSHTHKVTSTACPCVHRHTCNAEKEMENEQRGKTVFEFLFCCAPRCRRRRGRRRRRRRCRQAVDDDDDVHQQHVLHYTECIHEYEAHIYAGARARACFLQAMQSQVASCTSYIMSAARVVCTRCTQILKGGVHDAQAYTHTHTHAKNPLRVHSSICICIATAQNCMRITYAELNRAQKLKSFGLVSPSPLSRRAGRQGAGSGAKECDEPAAAAAAVVCVLLSALAQ